MRTLFTGWVERWIGIFLSEHYSTVHEKRSSFNRSLLRDNKHAAEKEQVIKLIRTIVEVGTVRNDSTDTNFSPRSVQLSETVVRSVIAVAEHAEDPFRLVCIETLTEIRS